MEGGGKREPSVLNQNFWSHQQLSSGYLLSPSEVKLEPSKQKSEKPKRIPVVQNHTHALGIIHLIFQFWIIVSIALFSNYILHKKRCFPQSDYTLPGEAWHALQVIFIVRITTGHVAAINI